MRRGCSPGRTPAPAGCPARGCRRSQARATRPPDGSYTRTRGANADAPPVFANESRRLSPALAGNWWSRTCAAEPIAAATVLSQPTGDTPQRLPDGNSQFAASVYDPGIRRPGLVVHLHHVGSGDAQVQQWVDAGRRGGIEHRVPVRVVYRHAWRVPGVAAGPGQREPEPISRLPRKREVVVPHPARPRRRQRRPARQHLPAALLRRRRQPLQPQLVRPRVAQPVPVVHLHRVRPESPSARAAAPSP